MLCCGPGQNPQANSKLEEWRLFCIKATCAYRVHRSEWKGHAHHAFIYFTHLEPLMCHQEKSIFNILNLCSGEIALRLAFCGVMPGFAMWMRGSPG